MAFGTAGASESVRRWDTFSKLAVSHGLANEIMSSRSLRIAKAACGLGTESGGELLKDKKFTKLHSVQPRRLTYVEYESEMHILVLEDIESG